MTAAGESIYQCDWRQTNTSTLKRRRIALKGFGLFYLRKNILDWLITQQFMSTKPPTMKTRLTVWWLSAFVLSLMTSVAEGVSCAGQVLGAAEPSNIPTGVFDTTAGSAYIQTGSSVKIPCCGIVSGWKFYSRSAGTLKLQTYRQTGGTNYLVTGETVVPGVLPDLNNKVGADGISVLPNDLFGWSSDADVIIPHVITTGVNDGILTQVTSPSGTVTWSGAVVDNRKYAVAIEVSASTPPTFSTPADGTTFPLSESALVNNVISTISTTDPDAGDVADLSVSLLSASGLFQIATAPPSGPDTLTVKATLSPGSYPLVIKVEDPCGKSATVSVTVTVTDDVPVITSLQTAVTIQEHAHLTATEKLLHTLVVIDNNLKECTMTGIPRTEPFVLKLIDGSSDWGIFFSYDAAYPLDYDIEKLYTLTVTCTDGTSNSIPKVFQINVLKNLDPTFDDLPTSHDVSAKTTKNGDLVYTVAASDTDGEEPLTYSMVCTCPFIMNSFGEIRATETLNFHQVPTYNATVSVTDKYNTVTSTLTLVITEINKAPLLASPSKTLPLYDVEPIDELSAPGTLVYAIVATDDPGDTLTYNVVWEPGTGNNLFKVDTDGKITIDTATELDYEYLYRTTGLKYAIQVEVCDQRKACSPTREVLIDIKDVNEPPLFIEQVYTVSTTEGEAGQLVDCAYFNVEDPDIYDTTTYTLTACTNCAVFHVTSTSSSCSGVIQMSRECDLDTPGAATITVSCTVTVSDKEDLTDTATLEIIVKEINDNPPVLDQTSYTTTVSNNTGPHSYLIDVDSTDLDFLKQHNEHTYTSSHPNLFNIDNIGRIYNTIDLRNVQAPTSYTFTITATDNGGLTDSAPVTITVYDVPTTTTTTTQATTLPETYDNISSFFDDKGNWVWVVFAAILGAIALALLGYMIYRCLSTPGACNSCYRCFGKRGKGKIGRGRVGDSNRNPKKSRLCDCFDRKAKQKELQNPGHGPWEPWKNSDFKDFKKWVG